MRARGSRAARASAARWFTRVSKFSAPARGMRSVIESGIPAAPREAGVMSTASLPITRYVVSLPPAMITRPGTGVTTVCSRARSGWSA